MHFVIVGGGAAGSLLALLVLRHAPASVRVTLVDRRAAFGRGLAYSAPAPHHRINVPADKMGGVAPADETGFIDWLAASGRPVEGFEQSFIPRAWFGDYLAAQLDAARAGGRLQFRHGDITALAREPGGRWSCTGPGLSLCADQVALCPGNPPPALWPTVPAGASGPRLVADVWVPGALEAVGACDSVLIAGTGATAIDALLDLDQRGHRGGITMTSRRGLLPLVDVPPGPYPDFFDPAVARRGLRSVLRRLREEVRTAAAQGVPWQHVVDAFRVHAANTWLQLGEADRRRFLRHGRAHWMVHRHRLAPDIAGRLEGMIAEGRLTLLAGRVRATRITADGCELELLTPRSMPLRLAADWMLNCIGPSEDFSRLDDPLWVALFRGGIVRSGPLNLGLDVDPQLRLIDLEGRAHPDLFCLGLPTRGHFWEITAVVHIRQQAEALALQLFPAAVSVPAAA